jgi:ribosomal protein S18 acetylase RimI-like enzyme
VDNIGQHWNYNETKPSHCTISIMNVSIRKATLQDAPDIAQVHVVSWQKTYRGIAPQHYLDSLDVNTRTREWKFKLEKAESDTFVAILDGKLCGFIDGGLARKQVQDFDAEFYSVNVHPAAKGQGIGRLLIRRLVETLRANGFTKVAVWVLADNPSRHFYEHLGGQEIGQSILSVGGADLPEIGYGWQDLQTMQA